MKKLFRLLILAGLLAGTVYFLMAYQLVQSKNGIRLAKKKEFGFSKPIVEEIEGTDVVDYLKGKVSDIDWDKLKKQTAAGWRELSDKLDAFSEDYDLEHASESVRKSAKGLRVKAKKEYDKLVKKWENGDIGLDQFKKKVADLHDWLSREMEELKAKIGDLK